MTIAGPFVPTAAEKYRRLEPDGYPAQDAGPSRCLERAVLCILLLFAIALFAINLSPALRFGDFSASTPKAPGDQFVHAIPARLIARPYDQLRPLKAGDWVVVDDSKSPSIRQVAATPNVAVMLRSGKSPKALYLVGKGTYVVMSEKGTEMVRGEEIRATIATPGR